MKVNYTKAEMRNVIDDAMPVMLAVFCTDDNKRYVYNKSNTFDTETGKFREFATGGGGGGSSEAEDIHFDSTGTDLDSDNVEDAIKEVNEKCPPDAIEVPFYGTGTDLTSENVQDAIKEAYANATDAGNISFNSAGSDIVSDNVESAIKEVRELIPEEILAEDVIFNPKSSGLESLDVNAAILEVNSKISYDAEAIASIGRAAKRCNSSIIIKSFAEATYGKNDFVSIPVHTGDVLDYNVPLGNGTYGPYLYVSNVKYTDAVIEAAVDDSYPPGYVATLINSSSKPTNTYTVPSTYDGMYLVLTGSSYGSSYRVVDKCEHIYLNGEDVFAVRKINDPATREWVNEKLAPIIGTDIVGLNGGERELTSKLLNMKYGDVGKSDSGHDYKQCCCLMHFSDWHQDTTNIGRLTDFWDKYENTGSYASEDILDGCINTGDVTATYFDESISDYYGAVDDRPFLLSLGNHDVWPRDDASQPYALDSTAEHWPWAGSTSHVYSKPIAQSETYNKFYRDYISSWNVVRPSGVSDACYYYKDFVQTNSSGTGTDYKVRLIVVDIAHQKNAQYTWFNNTLTNARANDFDVIVASHFEIGQHERVPIPFSSFEYGASSTSFIGGEFAEYIADFIDAGGNFICWLSGHQHCDGVGVLSADKRMLDINVATASSSQLRTADAFIKLGTKSQDCFNVLSIDYADKILKVMRIGRDYDRYMQHKDTFCYNYGTHKMMYPIVSPDPTNS